MNYIVTFYSYIGNSVLHFIEGPSVAVERVLTQLANHSHFQTLDAYGAAQSVIQSGRVVCNIEDRPTRLYNEWFSSQGMIVYCVEDWIGVYVFSSVCVSDLCYVQYVVICNYFTMKSYTHNIIHIHL